MTSTDTGSNASSSARAPIGADVTPKPPTSPAACSHGLRSSKAAMILERETLRAAYDAVIEELNRTRNSEQLTSGFYSKVGDAIFEEGYRALQDADAAQSALSHRTPPVRVVPAPVGSGKTSFSQALMAAIVRLGDADPCLSCGCVFVVKERQAADDLYRSLNTLLPDRVAIWTKDHDAKRTKPPETVKEPAAHFHLDDLEDYPVAIVTHAFYKDKRGYKARNYIRNGASEPRVLTIIDEQPDDVVIFDVTLSETALVLDAIQSDEQHSEFISPKLGLLVEFMAAKGCGGGNLEKPNDDPESWRAATASLHWFTTEDAKEYAKSRKDRIPNIVKVFGLAAAAYKVCAFITRYDSAAPSYAQKLVTE
jgi:hypothetical protein